MIELVVISGKGGTGKTSLVGAFAALSKNKVMCDADVDAADLHLILEPVVTVKNDFWAGHKAAIDPERCIQCGACLDWCRFNAISEDFVIDELSCEGCGVCVHFCPEKAIDFPENNCGEWYRSDTRFGPLFHARLGIAEENSGKLVSLIRKEARSYAESLGMDLILTDGPPGIGCPVIASIGGATAVLVVTEPTVSGKHDLDRVASLAGHFKVPVLVCVNKADLYWDTAREIEAASRAKGYRFVGHLPFDPSFTRAQVAGKTIVEYDDGANSAKHAVVALWDKIKETISEQGAAA